MSRIPAQFGLEDLKGCLTQARDLGFLSPQPIENQIEHSRKFLDLVPSEAKTEKVLDIGVGGGIPSLVFLYAYPSKKITGLDAMKKRVDFLESLKEQYLDLASRFELVNGRAEVVAREVEFSNSFDLVISRGFGPPATTAECAVGFLKVGGYLVVSGRPENEEQRWNDEKLSSIGLEFLEVRDSQNSHAAIIKKVNQVNDFPRSSKDIKKNPLW